MSMPPSRDPWPAAWSAGRLTAGPLTGSWRWMRGWGQVIHLGALLMTLALTPSSYRRSRRSSMARHLVDATMSTLPWFTLLSAFLCVIVIRIVIVTANSYGLTQYAVEMVVRVLVLELIPLAAALFVALRYGLPQGVDLMGLVRRGGLQPAALRAPARMLDELLPRVLAGMFAVVTLAAVSCVLALTLAYVAVHGFTPWAFGGYTRTVGHIFVPAVSLIFALKTFFFSLAVVLVPIASAVYDAPPGTSRTRAELRALVRMFSLLLVIELASLVGNYY